MPRATQEKIIASEVEKNVMIDIVDKRIDEFFAISQSLITDENALAQLSLWVERTRAEIKKEFSRWYLANINGKKIPKDLLVPAPRQDRIYRGMAKTFADSSCEVCGDTRVLNIAHIIPRADNGPDEEWNLMRLCADHHYLFDLGLLTETEWYSIDWASKDSRAQTYALEHRLPTHDWWKAR